MDACELDDAVYQRSVLTKDDAYSDSEMVVRLGHGRGGSVVRGSADSGLVSGRFSTGGLE